MSEKNPHLLPTTMRPGPGGGQLRVGNPGNRGGAGKMGAVLREKMRGSLANRLQALEELIDDPSTKTADRLRAMELYMKYGLGVAKDSDAWDRWSVVELVADLGSCVARHVDAGTLANIKNDWKDYFRLPSAAEG